MAMNYSYYGVPCTVDQLNVHLRQNKGYLPERVARVTWVSPTGDAIRFTAEGRTTLDVGNQFLVERGTYTNPLTTYQVTVAYQATPFIPGQATRFVTHNPTIPVVGDAGRVYWSLIPQTADTFTQGQLRSVDIFATGSQVEDLLVRDIPVQLNVPGHMVVADGMTSSFRPDGSARGTYSIKDPYEDRNYTKLIEGHYANKFGLARYVEPVTPEPLAAAPAATTVGPAGLGLIASGARRVEITDPLGRRMLRDAATGEVVANIPAAWIEDVSSEHDNGGSVGDLTGFVLHVPAAINGPYTLRIDADDGHSLSASVYDDNGVFASNAAADTSLGPRATIYDVEYSAATQSISVEPSGSVGVDAGSPAAPRLRVGTNPSRGPVQFVIHRSAASGDVLELFDIAGRKTDELLIPPGLAAGERVAWDWLRAGCSAGVYLARLASGGGTVRFVVLR